MSLVTLAEFSSRSNAGTRSGTGDRPLESYSKGDLRTSSLWHHPFW